MDGREKKRSIVDAIFDAAVQHEKARSKRVKVIHTGTKVIEPDRVDFLLAMKRKKLLGIYVSSNGNSH